MKIFIWLFVILGAALAVFELSSINRPGIGAPQQAALAAISICYVIIPYCVARAISEIVDSLNSQKIARLEAERLNIEKASALKNSINKDIRNTSFYKNLGLPEQGLLRAVDKNEAMQRWFHNKYGVHISLGQGARLVAAQDEGSLDAEAELLRAEIARSASPPPTTS